MDNIKTNMLLAAEEKEFGWITYQIHWKQKDGSARIPETSEVIYDYPGKFSIAGLQYRSVKELCTIWTGKTADIWGSGLLLGEICIDKYGRKWCSIAMEYPCFDSCDRENEFRYYRWFYLLKNDSLICLYRDDGKNEITVTTDVTRIQKEHLEIMKELGYIGPKKNKQKNKKKDLKMKHRQNAQKCLWGILVVLMSLVMLQAGKDASDNIWIEGDPTFRFYVALLWEILMGISAFVPVWLLSLLGLARSFLGENWLPIAEKVPVRVTKTILIAAAVLLVGTLAAEKICLKYTTAPFWTWDRIETKFGRWQILFAWTLFYSMLLYIEQWCIRRNDSRQTIRKKQAWVTVTLFMTQMIVSFLGGVALWYIPLSRVDCPNNLEDYYLWWFSLYTAVFFLPLWFFSARKTVRLFKGSAQWLALTTIVPKKISVLIAFVATGFMVQQIQKSRYWNEWTEFADVPEYGEAAAMGHAFQAMMWGLLLFYMICLFVKQIRAARRMKRVQ